MSIEKDLEEQIVTVEKLMENGDLSQEEATMVLNEIQSALEAHGLAKQEVFVARLATAVNIAKSLI